MIHFISFSLIILYMYINILIIHSLNSNLPLTSICLPLLYKALTTTLPMFLSVTTSTAKLNSTWNPTLNSRQVAQMHFICLLVYQPSHL